MNIEKIKEVLQLSKLLEDEGVGNYPDSSYPFKVGDNIFIRTVTLYYTGQVTGFNSGFVTLKDAAWIADTGRFADFLKEGKANEVEPFKDDVHIPLSSIIDVTAWFHKLFREQK